MPGCMRSCAVNLAVLYSSDMKIRVKLAGRTRFYYPDVSVVCNSNPPTESYQDQPVVIFEVLSRSTRRIDQGEKRDAYLTIPSLMAYALVEQEEVRVTVFRRSGEDFIPEEYEGLEQKIPFPELKMDLPLAEIYEGVELSPEPEIEEYR